MVTGQGAGVELRSRCVSNVDVYVGIGTIILNVKLKLKLQLNYINSWSAGSAYVLYPNPTN